jgi:hypothetical protein
MTAQPELERPAGASLPMTVSNAIVGLVRD